MNNNESDDPLVRWCENLDPGTLRFIATVVLLVALMGLVFMGRAHSQSREEPTYAVYVSQNGMKVLIGEFAPRSFNQSATKKKKRTLACMNMAGEQKWSAIMLNGFDSRPENERAALLSGDGRILLPRQLQGQKFIATGQYSTWKCRR